MNKPPEEYILVDEQRELDFLTTCLDKAGASHEQAAFIARMLVNSEVRGVRSHGINWAPGYCQKFHDGQLNPDPDIHVIHETPAVAVLDGDGGLGYMPTMRATEYAIAKAKEIGVGLGLVRYIGHNGAAGNYTRKCTEHGCVGFSVQGHRVDPPVSADGKKRSIAYPSLPPMSFSIPGENEPDVVLDMVAHVLSGLTAEQQERLTAELPGPFFKSIGLVTVAVLLGGSLAGAYCPADEMPNARWPDAGHGALVLAIHVDTVEPEQNFLGAVDRYVQRIRDHHEPLPGFDESLLPGAVEDRVMAMHQAEGIHFGEHEQQAAKQLHEAWDVPLPWD